MGSRLKMIQINLREKLIGRELQTDKVLREVQ